jgi:hypothetical protein
MRIRTQKENESKPQNFAISAGEKFVVPYRRPAEAFPSVEQLQAVCAGSGDMSPGKVNELLGDLADMERCASQLKNMILEARSC